MELWAYIAVVTGLVVLASWIILRLPPKTAAGILIVIGISMVPLNLLHPSIPQGVTAYTSPITLFYIIKGISIVLGTVLLLLYPMLARVNATYSAIAIVALLWVNILEIGAVEFYRYGLTPNVIAAVLLTLLTPTAARVSTIQSGNHERVFYPVGWAWVFAYLLWHVTFMLQISSRDPGAWVVFTFAQHLAALILIGRNSGRYLEARAISLTTIFVMWQILGLYPPPFTVSADWFNLALPYFQFASISLLVALTLLSAYRYRQTRIVRTCFDGFLLQMLRNGPKSLVAKPGG